MHVTPNKRQVAGVRAKGAAMCVTPCLRAGILVIGSLIWDTRAPRPDWRARRLDLSRKERVPAPIRYGRKSAVGARENQYTMTFSLDSPPGRAYIVPCHCEIRSFGDLVEEAEALATAEGLVTPSPRWKTFGAVGLLFRDPKEMMSSGLRERWSAYFSDRSETAEILNAYEALRERPPIGRDGLLTIEWPAESSQHDAARVDVLLATVNAPSLGSKDYATPCEIADSIVNRAPNKASYMRENVAASIRTYQDVEIWEAIESLGPRWINDDGYPALSRSVRESM